MKLPVSGIDVQFRAPVGSDDLAILESAGNVMERAGLVLARLSCVAERASGAHDPAFGEADWWAQLSVTDFEVALLGLRRHLFGDELTCMSRCSAPTCGARMELALSITRFCADVRPKLPRQVERCGEPAGWFRLREHDADEIRFRLPSVADQAIVFGRPSARALLAGRCIDAHGGARAVARVERAMEAMAPIVSRPLTGQCTECGAAMTMRLHVSQLVVDELKMAATGVHEEIHAIARTYHWDEQTILAMPQSRRQAYADTIRHGEQASS